MEEHVDAAKMYETQARWAQAVDSWLQAIASAGNRIAAQDREQLEARARVAADKSRLMTAVLRRRQRPISGGQTSKIRALARRR